MRLETAGRTEKVFRAVVSEARLIEKQDELLVEDAVKGSAAAFGISFHTKG
jgi:hypothetical protein